MASFNIFAKDSVSLGEQRAHGQKVSLYVNDYFNKKNFTPILEDECKDRVTDCVASACDRLGTYGCDERYEVNEILVWCRGNYDGGCIKAACGFLGTYGCDERYEIKEIVRACVGNFGGDCVTSVCARLGTYGCDERYEVVDVITKCSGN